MFDDAASKLFVNQGEQKRFYSRTLQSARRQQVGLG